VEGAERLLLLAYLLVALCFHRVDDDLKAAVVGRPRDLRLGRIAVAQRHGDELPDYAPLAAIAVHPRLFRENERVLPIAVELLDPRFARHGVLPVATLTAQG
jgi:hypothetical protein